MRCGLISNMRCRGRRDGQGRLSRAGSGGETVPSQSVVANAATPVAETGDVPASVDFDGHAAVVSAYPSTKSSAEQVPALVATIRATSGGVLITSDGVPYDWRSCRLDVGGRLSTFDRLNGLSMVELPYYSFDRGGLDAVTASNQQIVSIECQDVAGHSWQGRANWVPHSGN